MQVETFECQETASEPIEATEEALELIEQLELSGQKELVSRDEGDHARRSPYRKMRADERFVYKTICPKRTQLEKYKDGPIPLRVLQIAAHAKSLGLFRHFHVWSQEDSQVKDPVLVASNNEYDWQERDEHILARWGDELESFPVLLKRAAEQARSALVQQARKLVSMLESVTDAELIEKGPGRTLDW